MYDIIIIGAGPAGISAGIYAVSRGKRALILEKGQVGGIIGKVSTVTHYTAIVQQETGATFAARMKEQALQAGVEILNANVTGVTLSGDIKSVTTDKGTYEAKRIILANGGTPRKLGIPGEAELTGKGMGMNAAKDGASSAGKNVYVVGGADGAVKEALYAFLDIPDGIRLLNALRTRKALRNTRILAVVRNNSQQSLGGPDAFLSNDDATRRLGINFTYLSIHEFLDMLHVDESGKNYTLPGRNACNLTSEDMVEVERWTDELMAGTDDITMDRKYVVNSVKAAVLAKKLMAHFGCNAFTAPCPDTCATRRMNQEQFTFCLTHSLLNEQGIPSGCEFDLIGTSAIASLGNLTGKAPYMGNTQPCVYFDGKVMNDFVGISYIPEMDHTPNIYYTGHATPTV